MAHTDQLAQAHQRIEHAVQAIVTGDQWRQMLQVAARFHTYSPNNVWLILAQNPDATQVAGFHTWRKVGRQVRKGERGIAILAPLVSRARPVTERDTAEHPGLVRVLRGFRVVYVFDLAQTDGNALPDVAPTMLTGQDPTGWYDRVASLVATAGFTLQRKDCSPANGTTNFTTRQVTVRPDLSPAGAVKTLAHELGHVLLHDDAERTALDRARFEVEAESVAYLVCATVGIDTDDYSFPYLARWSGGDLELIRTTAARAMGCARQILTDLGLAVADQAA
ncbi:MAG: ArdC-like ssDNA-binding domain-containing protein [Acidimicrobiales bacterium]